MPGKPALCRLSSSTADAYKRYLQSSMTNYSMEEFGAGKAIPVKAGGPRHRRS